MAQSKASARAATRTNLTRNIWTRPASPVTFGREEFRFRVYRAQRKLPPLDIDPWVEGANWQRSGTLRTGELNFRRPLGDHTASQLTTGDEIRCEVAVWGSRGHWRPLWRMKITTASHQIREGIIALALKTSMHVLTSSRVSWKFTTSHAKPHGWTAREITIHVCRRFHIPIGRLPKATHRIDRLVEKSASPLEVIVRAWRLERTHTGRMFDVDFSPGVLNVTEVREPRYMLLLGPTILDATIEQSLTHVASVVVATATHKVKGEKKAKRLRVRVVSDTRRRRYGTIVKTLHAPRGIDSLAELRKWARQRLALLFRPAKSITLTHPGMPLVDRGDAVRVRLPEADLDQLAFVTSARHDVSAGSYTMDLTFGFSDPWATEIRKDRVARKKAAAAARRRRRTAAKHPAPKPKRASTRSNA